MLQTFKFEGKVCGNVLRDSVVMIDLGHEDDVTVTQYLYIDKNEVIRNVYPEFRKKSLEEVKSDAKKLIAEMEQDMNRGYRNFSYEELINMRNANEKIRRTRSRKIYEKVEAGKIVEKINMELDCRKMFNKRY